MANGTCHPFYRCAYIICFFMGPPFLSVCPPPFCCVPPFSRDWIRPCLYSKTKFSSAIIILFIVSVDGRRYRQTSIAHMKCATHVHNLVHDIVCQEQWIRAIHDILFHGLTRKVSKRRRSAVWETNPACERTCISHMHPSVKRVHPTADGSPTF